MKDRDTHSFRTRQELAAFLGIHRQTLYRFIIQHKLKISPGLLNREEQEIILQALSNNGTDFSQDNQQDLS